MSTHNKKYRIIRQHDQSDCGVACLLSLIEYYGGNGSLEQLRKLSGTSIQGTSLLGLYQAALSSGFDTEGCEADFDALKKYGKPVILHVLVDDNQEHYVVCFDYNQGHFAIGDPAKGVLSLSEEELGRIWKSKACLTLEPNEKFVTGVKIKKEKKRWMLDLIREDIGLLGVSIALGIVITMLGMTMVVFSQKLIDVILPLKQYTKLWTGIVLLSLLLIIRLVLSAIRQYMLYTQGRQFNNRIISSFYKRLLFLPKSFFDTRKIGELTARLNDTRRIQDVVNQIAGEIIIDALIITVSIAFLFSYSWQIAVLVLLCLPFFFLVIYRNNAGIIRAQQDVMVGYALSEGNFINTMQGIATIKSINKQKVFQTRNEQIYGLFQDRVFSLGKVNIRLGWISGSIGVIITVAVLVMGCMYVLQGQLKLGELMAVLGLSGTLLPSVANLALVSIPINEAKVAFDRMFEFTSMEQEKTGDYTVGQPVHKVELSGLSFRFPGRKQLLNRINIEIRRGEIIAVAGESGCGKSTICQILQKFYSPEEGTVFIDGVAIETIDTAAWRDRVGVLSQDAFIFNGTILDNIVIGLTEEEMPKVLEFCRETGFNSFFEEMPQGYNTIVGEEGINLSGGQKQLIDWARVLYRKPQVLIVDEGTSAMDTRTEQFILNLLLKMKSGMATLFITHRLHLLKKWCDYIYVLENKTIAYQGTHAELLGIDNLYKDYWAAIN